MAFEHNDIATKSGLRAGLGETDMGFEHNDIVTTDVMNAAIAAGGGGGGDFLIWHVTINSVAKQYGEINAEFTADFEDTPYKMLTIPYINGVAYYSYTVAMDDGVTDFDFGFMALDESGTATLSTDASGLANAVTGSITVEEDGGHWYFRITGDGTITITAA